ncbi:hypothetical protein VTL71DRAFT_3400 [Oculimacula yallundae]|uniref:C2H2-type domain-containing protein n=1 Tax=Oculimacula yallundae TaxID=86028 RepID=A0ABR4C719_9HELO
MHFGGPAKSSLCSAAGFVAFPRHANAGLRRVNGGAFARASNILGPSSRFCLDYLPDSPVQFVDPRDLLLTQPPQYGTYCIASTVDTIRNSSRNLPSRTTHLLLAGGSPKVDTDNHSKQSTTDPPYLEVHAACVAAASVTISPGFSLISCEFPDCDRTFTLPCHYNRHKKSHTHPIQCPICGRGFETPKDVKRHHNDIHDTTKVFFCHVRGCKYERGGGGKGFPRKENWKRHLRNRHGLLADQMG